MTTAYWCVLIALFLPYVFILAAKIASRGAVNNHTPRLSEEKLTGWMQRAYWAQNNSFEVFPAFAAAIIIAQLAGAAQGTVDGLALAFIGSRLVYGACYIADLHWQRTLVWLFGIGCIIALFVSAA